MYPTVAEVQKRYPEYNAKEIDDMIAQFKTFDISSTGKVTESDLTKVLEKLGEKPKPAEVQQYIAEVDEDGNGSIEFMEFVQILRKIKSGQIGGGAGFAGVYTKQMSVNRIQSATGSHSYSDEEKEAFVEHINDCLKDDKDVKDKLPLPVEDLTIFKATHDGLLICKLINDAVPGTIDERALNTKKPINEFKAIENHNIAINSCKAIGCNVVNMGPHDIMSGTPHLVLGLIWQIVKIGLFRKINLTSHPGLVRLLEDGETLQDLLKLPPDQILLRWMNYHLKAAGSQKRVKNFSGDIKDSEAYTIVLNQISKGKCSTDPMKTPDGEKRAEQMLTQADKIKCRKYVKARDVVKGNAKLNMAFVAHMFNTCPALDPPEQPVELEVEETREEKAYRTWLNHFGFDPTVNWLYEDLRDGIILLKVMDKLQPGIVDWTKVNTTQPIAPFKKIENCNYAVLKGKELKFSLVGISGKDLVDGNKTLTLGLIWQMMRCHCVSIVKALGPNATDDDVKNACNDRIKAAGKTHTITGFKDASIATGHYCIDLVAATDSGAVNYDIVSAGATDEDKLANARYALTVARKVGAVVFALAEDIVEVKPKMLLTFSAACLACDVRK
jgi:hypothetical protein